MEEGNLYCLQLKPVMEEGNLYCLQLSEAVEGGRNHTACSGLLEEGRDIAWNGVDVYCQQEKQLRGIQGILEEEVARGLNKDRRH